MDGYNNMEGDSGIMGLIHDQLGIGFALFGEIVTIFFKLTFWKEGIRNQEVRSQ